ncbi:beta-N-acetylhexosaminidase [Tamlana sp. 2201CG12-4]|uniref:beta-N-acetylhexosaminidase n=1 Tax=Tamlana sp. 2201CG12-4 TaxID=3112582 RepID=UPI002DB9B369|nr:beta-N-acetylhexosaminidase [Tamlana sp. 2201CG12-4]MEC3907224.1 beta-N-acetylhexosaminidase [Tamlana sp. 2201CG12-4]
MIYRTVLFMICIMVHTSLFANDGKTLNLLPLPVEVKLGTGQFQLNEEVVIIAKNSLALEAQKFIEKVQSALGFKINITEDSNAETRIYLILDPQLNSKYGKESYKINVSTKIITIKAGGDEGAFYALQTLRQLLPTEIFSRVELKNIDWTIPCVEILDYPRFDWRGYMLDVSRTFADADYVKHTLDIMAEHKMNVFHWHLVDNNGWRIEIKKHPWLTEKGAWRMQPNYPKRGITGRYGGFYTQEQIRDIVAYAKERHITVLPEIDIPGHSTALLHTIPEFACPNAKTTGYVRFFNDFPQRGKPFDKHEGSNAVCAGNDEVFPFFDEIIEELVSLFPCEYIHIGGDEVNKEWWEACPKCQQRIRDEGLSDSDELQAYFIKRLESIINTHNKKLIGWDEILEGGITKSSTIMSWRGNRGALTAVQNGQKTVIASNQGYYFQKDQTDNPLHPKQWPGMLTLQTAYEYEPIPLNMPQEQMDLVLGIQSALWTPFTNKPDLWDLAVYPRNFAVSENAWSESGHKNWEEFQQRVQKHRLRLAYEGVAYWREASERVGQWTSEDLKSPKGLVIDVTSFLTQAGKYLIVLDHTTGTDGLEIRSVKFLKNGKPIASDFHYGTTEEGSDKDRMYFVDLQSLEKDAKYELEIGASGFGGMDSNGDIHMFKP